MEESLFWRSRIFIFFIIFITSSSFILSGWIIWNFGGIDHYDYKPYTVKPIVDASLVNNRLYIESTDKTGQIKQEEFELGRYVSGHISHNIRSRSMKEPYAEYYYGYRKPFLWLKDEPSTTPFRMVVVHLRKAQ